MSARIVKAFAVCGPFGYQLRVSFADGLCGTADVTNLIDNVGCYKPLLDPRVFMCARPELEHGDLVWPICGVRLAHEVLYEAVKNSGGKLAPAPVDRNVTIDPDFYAFMARALVPVAKAPRRRHKRG